MKLAFIRLLGIGAMLLGLVQPAAAGNPWPQPIDVPLTAPLAQLAISNALPEFATNGAASPGEYRARVLRNDQSLTVMMFDMANCQPSHGRKYPSQPILFVTLSADATTVIDSRFRHLLEC